MKILKPATVINFDIYFFNSLIISTKSRFCTQNGLSSIFFASTDYGRPVKKLPSLHGQKSNPNPKFIDTAEAYFVCPISSKSQISLSYAFRVSVVSVCQIVHKFLLGASDIATIAEEAN